MPYPNYHAIRLRQPGEFVRLRTKKFGTGILAYGGPLKKPPKKKVGVGKAAGWTLQAVRFHIDNFTFAQAKKWMTDHKYPRSSWKKAEKATGKGKKSMTEQAFRTLLDGRFKAL